MSPRVKKTSTSIQKRLTMGYTDARGVATERAGAGQAIGGAPVAAEDAPARQLKSGIAPLRKRPPGDLSSEGIFKWHGGSLGTDFILPI